MNYKDLIMDPCIPVVTIRFIHDWYHMVWVHQYVVYLLYMSSKGVNHMSYGTTMVLTVSKATSTVWCKLEDGPKFLSLHFMHSWREDFVRFFAWIFNDVIPLWFFKTHQATSMMDLQKANVLLRTNHKKILLAHINDTHQRQLPPSDSGDDTV